MAVVGFGLDDPYNNTIYGPSAKSAEGMSTETNPMLLNGWRSTSVTRRIGRLTYEQAEDER